MSLDPTCPAGLISGGICTCGEHTTLAPVLVDDLTAVPMPVLIEESSVATWTPTLCKSCGHDIAQRQCPLCIDTQAIVHAIGLIEQARESAGLDELRAIVARRVK